MDIPFGDRHDEVGELARAIGVFQEAMRRNDELTRTIIDEAAGITEPVRDKKGLGYETTGLSDTLDDIDEGEKHHEPADLPAPVTPGGVAGRRS